MKYRLEIICDDYDKLCTAMAAFKGDTGYEVNFGKAEEIIKKRTVKRGPRTAPYRKNGAETVVYTGLPKGIDFHIGDGRVKTLLMKEGYRPTTISSCLTSLVREGKAKRTAKGHFVLV